jgi:cytidylate kinase
MSQCGMRTRRYGPDIVGRAPARPKIMEESRWGTVRILLSGLSGTGSTTAAKRIAEDLGLHYVYGGAIFRKMAKERGIPLEELVESLERNSATEKEVDDHLKALGSTEDDILIESRTIGWILPKDVPAIRIWLTCDLPERLQRVQNREHHARSPENLLRREASDNKRYRALYGIEPEDYTPFDLVLDTTSLSVDQVVEEIESFIRARQAAEASHRTDASAVAP